MTELIHELITLDQELITLDVGRPEVEVVLEPLEAVVVAVTVTVDTVAGGVPVLLLQAVPMPPIAMTATIPAVAAT